MEEAGSAAVFQVAAVGRVAVARPEAGDKRMIELTKKDYEVVSVAIREAEKRTSGQIVCVLAHSSSEYAYVPIVWAIVLALAAPWPLIEFTQWSVQRIFLLQLVIFVLAGFVFSWMPLRLAIVPRPIQRLRAHRAALEQFVVRRVTHTGNRCGILIFVSMAEHYARVIADEGIAQKVRQAEWQAAVDTLIEHIRSGAIAAGFVAAIERCSAVLAAYAPPDGSANELPDRLYVI
jgi:putative membrane protein